MLRLGINFRHNKNECKSFLSSLFIAVWTTRSKYMCARARLMTDSGIFQHTTMLNLSQWLKQIILFSIFFFCFLFFDFYVCLFVCACATAKHHMIVLVAPRLYVKMIISVYDYYYYWSHNGFPHYITVLG